MNDSDILSEVKGCVGLITLNRPRALNALTRAMLDALRDCLLAWQDDDRVRGVAIRGNSQAGPFGAFCAGGDIRFFHQTLLAGDPAQEDYFTAEYALDHLIHRYPKPYLAFMDGVVMGGGMGISQGASLRLVTHRTRMAMPETTIGLFPDVGGGYFLSRCPGHAGEWLALTGQILGAGEAIALGLADRCVDADRLPAAWDALADIDPSDTAQLNQWLQEFSCVAPAAALLPSDEIERYFGLPSVSAIVSALESGGSDWAQATAATLRRRSPLMLHVALEQVRRARQLSLADDLRMERSMMQHVFYPRHLQRQGAQTEAAEGIRALAIDKDNAPRWNPARIEDVSLEMVLPFFDSPWPEQHHPLRNLG